MNNYIDINIIEKLCLKRLCIPCNTDIELVRKGIIKSLHTMYNQSNHIAYIFNDKKNIFNALSYGINMYDTQKNIGSRHKHSEAVAIDNLPILPNKKHLKQINILVIRTSMLGKIGMSKPCIKCILDMNTIPQKKGYIIKYIYYSDRDGQIIRTTVKELLNSQDFHISRYYKNHNFNFNPNKI